MKVLLLFLIGMSFSSYAKVETEISGNIEGQARHSWNNPEADDLLQDWNEENFYLLYGNVNGKLDFGHSRLETNLFTRYSQSKLYNPGANALGQSTPYLATQFYTFPNTLVARNVFKLEYKRQDGDHQLESVLNKLYYEWNYDEHRFMVGRMYINYGLGEIFNPLNPFNQPTGLTSISQVAQGNDGLSFTFFASDSHTIQFLLLGDKRFEGYDGKITRTIWAHGEVQLNDKIQIDYVIGEDQDRQKVGGQFIYRFEEAMAFTQVLYQTEYVDNEKPSENLWDVLLGYDQQLTALWHLRVESGYQKRDRKAPLPIGFGERFLPSEYFVALANIYEIHPLVKINGTIVNDIKSGFTYMIVKGIYDLGHNMEAELFGYVPVAKGDSTDVSVQKLVTTDVGVALRAFF